MHRLALAVAAAAVLAGCDLRPFDLDAYVKKEYPRCKGPDVCGDLAYVDCGAAADGPAYYLRKRDGALVSNCGGACMCAMERAGCDAEQKRMCATLCPPPEWTCGPR